MREYAIGEGFSAATIRYADSESPKLAVRLIYVWNRGDITPDMSTSSGLKDSIRNRIWTIFEQRPEVDRVMMVRAGGPIFLLMRTKDNCWFDCTGKQVVAEVPKK